MTWANMRPGIGWSAALILLIGSGIVQGRFSGRWASAPSLAAAFARLDQLPAHLGTWSGEIVDPDQATLKRAGVAGGISRRYRDPATGQSVSVLLVCGRPGPVSVHTPDVCYVGAGYDLAAAPTEPIAGFRAAKMVRPTAAIDDSLAVYWSWNAADRWEVTANPRLSFGAKPYLYKLYVVGKAEPGADLATNYVAGFASRLIQDLDLRPRAGGQPAVSR